MSTPGDEPDAIRQLLRLRANRWRGCPSHLLRHSDRGDTHVRLDVGQRDLHGVVRGAQPRVTLVDMKHGRELHAAEILVVRVAQLVQHVPIDRVGNPRVDHLEQILVAERPYDFVLPHRGE